MVHLVLLTILALFLARSNEAALRLNRPKFKNKVRRENHQDRERAEILISILRDTDRGLKDLLHGNGQIVKGSESPPRHILRYLLIPRGFRASNLRSLASSPAEDDEDSTGAGGKRRHWDSEGHRRVFRPLPSGVPHHTLVAITTYTFFKQTQRIAAAVITSLAYGATPYVSLRQTLDCPASRLPCQTACEPPGSSLRIQSVEAMFTVPLPRLAIRSTLTFLPPPVRLTDGGLCGSTKLQEHVAKQSAEYQLWRTLEKKRYPKLLQTMDPETHLQPAREQRPSRAKMYSCSPQRSV